VCTRIVAMPFRDNHECRESRIRRSTGGS